MSVKKDMNNFTFDDLYKLNDTPMDWILSHYESGWTLTSRHGYFRIEHSHNSPVWLYERKLTGINQWLVHKFATMDECVYYLKHCQIIETNQMSIFDGRA